jgi:hypothetical protein
LALQVSVPSGNLNIHRKKPLTDLYGAEFGGEIWDRFTVHYCGFRGM